MPTIDGEGAPDEFERLWDELASIAKQTAALLIQPDHESADVAALDAHADAVRGRIKEIQAKQRPPERVGDWRGSRLLSGG